jgi:hypothetical protein
MWLLNPLVELALEEAQLLFLQLRAACNQPLADLNIAHLLPIDRERDRGSKKGNKDGHR